MSDDASPVAMNDLAERLLGPEGSAEARRHAERLDHLRQDVRAKMQAGAAPGTYARLQQLARALDYARVVMVAMSARSTPDVQEPRRSSFFGGMDR
jgi:hypothetical protein